MKKAILFSTLLSGVALLGALCPTQEPATTVNEAPTTVNVNAAPANVNAAAEPIPWTAVTSNLVDSTDKYSELRYQNGTGDCMDQGLPTTVSYVEVGEVGYQSATWTRDGVAEYDDQTLVTFDTIGFDIDLDFGAARCEGVSSKSTGDAKFTCTSEDESQSCTATFELVVIP